MYSLHDITSVCPKLEPDSDEGECNEEEHLSNHAADNQTSTFSEGFHVNNNTIHVNVSEYKTTENGNTSIHERTTTGMGPHDNISISQSSDMFPGQTTVANTSASHTSASMEMSGGQLMNGYTMVPVHENNGREALYYPASTAQKVIDTQNGTQEIYTNNIDSYERMFFQQYGAPEGLPAYQSSSYGTMPYDHMVSNGEFSPYQGLATYSGTHRSLTAYELGINPKPCCQCSCHLPVSLSSHAPAIDMKTQRPSVIMVPTKSPANVDRAFWDAPSKDESTARMLMTENAILRRDFQENSCNEMVDSDSSDEDEDGKQEKYFRMNIDGTAARFKLTREDWERIPINTFPSGGRLLSGDWTKIFLEKVKESNPWCSLRFKNNHVRSENSRKIHSAVFFRGGAECKRPECNVKVRFIIQKEKGKYVDVTYKGNVCHSSQLGGSDVKNDKKRRQVHRTCMPSSQQE